MKSTHISIRFPPELLAKLRALAVSENRTLSNLIVKTMQGVTAKQPKKQREIPCTCDANIESVAECERHGSELLGYKRTADKA